MGGRVGEAVTPRCLICDKPLSPVAQFDGWCDTCVGKALAGLLALRDTTPDQIAVRAACFQDWGVPFLARVIVGRVPFEQVAE